MINTPMSVDDAPVALPAAIDTSTALANYDAASRALAAAVAVDEVQEIRAQAEAMRAYAKQAKNRQMEVDAAEIRIRAERRLGELMGAQRETVGLAKGGGDHRVPIGPGALPSLGEAGIDKHLAHRARTYAAVPKDQFEQLLSKKRRRENARVVLDPEFQAEAESAARDLEIERDERIALSGGGELAAENERLQRQVALLDRRIAALQEENSALKFRENMWRERAVTAGWKKGGANV
jgi:FtsZ-binding cell division protein ZapB